MKKSMRRSMSPLYALLLAAACGPSGGGGSDAGMMPIVDEKAAQATAGCEEATAMLRMAGENMLPGRNCQACHKANGQAAKFIWTFSGTVFGSNTARCNDGGLAGVKVEILDMAGNAQKDAQGQPIVAMTNSVGNFYSTTKINFPFKARISKGTLNREMFGAMSTTSACAVCHQNPPMNGAPGRIFLN